jgi:glycosyltransferase involved in cell wall biosynthesis
LDNSPTKFGIHNIAKRSDGVILYSGPLTKDRFPYATVLNALKQTKSSLLIVGRSTNNGAEHDMVEEIIDHVKKLDLEDRISIVQKLLTEDEKVDLLNFADMVIQPFTTNTQVYVAVDPPIFLLEAMSCGKPVITSKTYSFQSLIKNGYNGYAINWDDPSAVDEALRGCQATSKLGLNARQTILKQFSTEFVSETIQGIYNDYN